MAIILKESFDILKPMAYKNPMSLLVHIYRIESEIQQAKARGNYKLAIELYDTLIELKNKLPNRAGLAKTIAEKGLLLENLGFFRDALDTYKDAATLTIQSPNTALKQFIHSKLSELGGL